MKLILIFTISLSFATVTSQISNAAVAITGNPSDVVIDPTGTSSDAASSRPSRVGASSATAAGSRTGVFVFQLPEIPVGYSSIVTNASLSFVVASVAGQPAYNIDLYGLGVRSTPAVLAKALTETIDNDNYAGPDDTTNAYKIFDNLIVAGQASAGTVLVETSAFTLYVASEFTAANATDGGYLFLRLNPDVADPGAEHSGINVRFAGVASNGAPAPNPDLPTLTLEFAPAVVPEPATAGLLASGLLSLVLRRPKR